MLILIMVVTATLHENWLRQLLLLIIVMLMITMIIVTIIVALIITMIIVAVIRVTLMITLIIVAVIKVSLQENWLRQKEELKAWAAAQGGSTDLHKVFIIMMLIS